ncbi:exosortase, partial [archaeon]|nr:exosortase [archaeon]
MNETNTGGGTDATGGMMSFRKYIIPCILLISAFCACFSTTFQWLHYKYELPESYYSHGYLIPFVSLYLIYINKEELKNVAVSSSLWGLILIFVALGVHYLGVIGAVNFISGFAIQLYVIGCSLYLLGNQITKKILFPLLFLAFMFPVPDEFLNIVALPIKSLATTFALMIVDILDIPYIRDGFNVHLSNAVYLVGTPCNGIRSLISFFALGFLIIHILRLSLLKS